MYGIDFFFANDFQMEIVLGMHWAMSFFSFDHLACWTFAMNAIIFRFFTSFDILIAMKYDAN